MGLPSRQLALDSVTSFLYGKQTHLFIAVQLSQLGCCFLPSENWWTKGLISLCIVYLSFFTPKWWYFPNTIFQKPLQVASYHPCVMVTRQCSKRMTGKINFFSIVTGFPLPSSVLFLCVMIISLYIFMSFKEEKKEENIVFYINSHFWCPLLSMGFS